LRWAIGRVGRRVEAVTPLEKARRWASELEPRVREARSLWRKSRRYVTLAGNVLRDLHYARGGGRLAQVTAAASVAGYLADAAYPELSIEDELALLGYRLVNTPLAGFLCELVERRGGPTRTMEHGSEEVVKLWENGCRGIAVVYRNGEYESGPYVLADDDSLLIDTTIGELWNQGADLMLEREQESRERHGYRRYVISTLEDPGPYIGEPGPRYWADRLAAYGGRPRTMLIKGPSGVGKSVLARHVGRLAAGGAARTLKVTGEAVQDFGAFELRDIARFLQPTVLLLDDLDVVGHQRRVSFRNGESMLDGLLTTFETLRVEGCLVIVTKMETVSVDDPRRGEHYIEGMRPGRIDELVLIPPPGEQERGAILKHYYGVFQLTPQPSERAHRAIVRMTEGLPGAYLKEVVERLSVHGVGSAKAEIISVLQTAPSPPRERRKGKAIAFVRSGKGEKMSVRIKRRAEADQRRATKLRECADRLEQAATKRLELVEQHMQREEKAVKKKKKKKTKGAGRKSARKPVKRPDVGKLDILAESVEGLIAEDEAAMTARQKTLQAAKQWQRRSG
jgi:hypothetical protein